MTAEFFSVVRAQQRPIDLGDGGLSVVTRIIGYDAHTYAIYSRAKTGWKNVYGGGGVAL